MTYLRFLSTVIFIYYWLVGCTTTDFSAARGPKLSGYDILPDKPAFSFPEKEANVVYQDLKTQEKLKTTNSKLHRNQGLLICKKVGNKASCTLNFTTPGQKILTKGKTLATSQTPSFTKFLKDLGALDSTDVVVMNAQCNYLGLQSPPYGKELTDCKVFNPRFLNEIIIRDKEASEISYKLIEEMGHTPGIKLINGTIRCESKKQTCAVKAVKTSKSETLTQNTALKVIEKFTFARNLVSEIQGVDLKSIKIGYFATVQCHVNFSGQVFACRIKL